MVVKEEQERVKTLISDTVTLLCRNGLSYKSKFCINALIGITLDEDEIMLVDIRETVKNIGAEDSAEESGDASNQTAKSLTSRKRKKRKRRNREDNGSYQSDSDASEGAGVGSGYEDNTEEPASKRLVKEEEADEDSDDLVFIKDEPADTSSLQQMTSFGGALYQQQHSQQQPQQQSGDILSNLAQQGQLYATPAASENLPPTQWDQSSSQVPFSQPPSAAAANQLNMSTGSMGDGSSQQVGFSRLYFSCFAQILSTSMLCKYLLCNKFRDGDLFLRVLITLLFDTFCILNLEYVRLCNVI